MSAGIRQAYDNCYACEHDDEGYNTISGTEISEEIHHPSPRPRPEPFHGHLLALFILLNYFPLVKISLFCYNKIA